jgi:hypothetical protein
MYKLCPTNPNGMASAVKRLSDHAFIPADPANTDYQAYLQWVAEGNEPTLAEEPQ